LPPKHIDKLCNEIRQRLVKKHDINNLGIVCTDSHTTPLRRGVTGITLGISGVKQLEDIRGNKDIFGREIQTVRVNKLEPLTNVAVMIMGECAEQIPIVILRNHKGIIFDEKANMDELKIDIEDDIYKPLLDVFMKN